MVRRVRRATITLLRAGVALAALPLASLAPTAPAAAQERTVRELPATDLPGGDFRTLREVPIAVCTRECIADPACRGYTYNERARWCFLKSEVNPPVAYEGATSAVVETRAAAAQPLPVPTIASLPAGEARREGDRLEALVASVRAGERASAFFDGARAQRLSTNLSADWADFAQTLLSQMETSPRRREAADRLAFGGAYNALRRASRPAEQGRALRLLSLALERRGAYRAAIDTSAASLALALDVAEEDRLQRLRRDHGFRILDYAVDSDTRTPRLCVQFSEALRGTAAELERFVAVAGDANPTLSVDGQQLCVEGLAHGTRYAVTVREGLPSDIGEDLMQRAELTGYVRERTPTVRFDANKTVLPASAEGVPVVSVNTQRLDLALYRINERNLADVVRRGDLERQLGRWDVSEIVAGRGSAIWEGTMEVAPVPNEEVTTLFPVGEVVETLEPGVYVLTAAPQERQATGTLATQWFVVSDIGLTAFSGRGVVDVFVRALSSAAPRRGVALELVARNNAVLASATTDGEGHARLAFAPGEGEGSAPALLTARSGTDFAFLSLAGAAFELTDRGVGGRAAPGPVDAFLASERGVYRAGETVHLTALVRDDRADALDLPVTLKLVRPDGKVSRRLTRRSDAAGGVVVDLPLTRNAATGTWTVSAHIDPEGPAVGSTRFLVEDFVPQRIEVALAADQPTVASGGTLEATVAADFLYGAPAANLMLEGSLVVREADTIAGLEGYRFGLHGEPFEARRIPLAALPRTGADGRARLRVDVPDVGDSVGALEALLRVSVREPSGRQVADTLTLPILSGVPVIGVRPLFEGAVGEGQTARFSLVALGAARERIAIPDAEWTLTRVRRDYQWYRRNDRWSYAAVERFEQVADGTVAIPADGTATVGGVVEWGEYRLEVVDPRNGQVATSVSFNAGWAGTAASADTPDVLTVSLAKEAYAPGESAQLRIEPRYAGRALVAVMTDSVRWHRLVDVPLEGTEVAIPVTDDLAPGAYVGVSLVRPAAPQSGAPLPTRAVGIAHLAVGTADRTLAVRLEPPQIARPGGPFEVPVTVAGLGAGEVAYLTVAAVDVGILNITGHEPPDVDGHYLGQRRLGIEMRDLYGELIDAYGAALGRIRSGGDGTGAGTEALPPNETPVSLFSGLIRTDAEGRASATFDAPPFNGTLRVMAMAWSETKVGDAAVDMIVRDPVVVSGSLPRFLAPGDETRLRLDVHNVNHAPGDYRLALAARSEDGGAVPIVLDDGTPSARTFSLGRDERTLVEIPLRASGLGTALVTATLTGPDGLSIARDYTLPVRPAAAPVTQRRLVALAPGESATVGAGVLDGFREDASVTLTVGAGPIDVAGLLAALERFPYGCAEQTVSRALPLVYANSLARAAGLEVDADLPQRIDDAIRRVLAYQSTSGGFGLWGPGADLWLTAYVMDFLGRAAEEGHEVPQDALDAGLDRLQSMLSYTDDVSGSRGSEIAYALYVLARAGRAAIGDLRYFAQEKWEAFQTPLARAQLAASLALSGDAPLADRLFARLARSAPASTGRGSRADYGTPVRDAAATLTLASESRAPAATVSELARVLDRLTDAAPSDYSTQEAAWLVLSASALGAQGTPILLGDAAQTAPITRTLGAGALAAGTLVQNRGAETLSLVTTVRGTPRSPGPATRYGVSVEREHLALDGTPVDPATLSQNDRLVVRLTITVESDVPLRLMLTDLLPAGFEIENPRLLTDATAGLPLVQRGAAPEYTEFRDDRFAAAWPLVSERPGTQRMVSYVVRAVSPGTFVAPPAEVSDMYQPQYLARTGTGRVAIAPTR